MIGHSVRITNRIDGLQIAFRVRDGRTGDWVLSAIRDGIITACSVTATPLRSRVRDGVLQREKAHVVAVALVAEGAYTRAHILGIRRTRSSDQPVPTTTLEEQLWTLEAADAKVSAILRDHIDRSLDERHTWTNDPSYLRAQRLHEQIAEQRADLERRLHPQPDPADVEAEQPRPKVLRRVSGPIAIR